MRCAFETHMIDNAAATPSAQRDIKATNSHNDFPSTPALRLPSLSFHHHEFEEPWHSGLHLSRSSCYFHIVLLPSSTPLRQTPPLQCAFSPTRIASRSSPRCRQPPMSVKASVEFFPRGFLAPVRYFLIMDALVCISISLSFHNQRRTYS